MKKTVLVTGGAGFIGHHFIKRILLEGYRVVCLDRLDFSGNLNRLAEIMHELPPIVASNLQVIYHDLRAEINPQLAKQ